ncbi:MAG: Gfo/Idh/MocA family protein [Planctomycetota bacterium]|jgi:predicted dehydrogenase
MLKVGIVGFGFMGRMHYQSWKDLGDAQTVAVCETNPNVVEDSAKAVGNFEGAAADVDFSTLKLYTDFEKMLSEVEMDAISITLPTYMHAEYSIKALKAGVNVLCEKPMALNTADCEKMIAAAEASGKVLFIGHCLRFSPAYARVKEFVADQTYGKVVTAMFQRLGSIPTWSWENWFLDEQRSGGVVLDLHIHDTDYVQYLFGMPHAVSSFQGKDSNGQVAHIITHYHYDDDKLITAEGGWAAMPSFEFEESFKVMLEKATAVYNLSEGSVLKICPAEGEAFKQKLSDKYEHLLQTEHFAKMLRGENPPEITTLQQSLNSIKLIEAEKESAEKGQRISLA